MIAATALHHGLTVAEIRFGIEVVTDTTKRAELHDWLAHKVRPMFEPPSDDGLHDLLFKSGTSRSCSPAMPTSANSGYACCGGVTLAAPAVELVLDDVEQPAMHPVGQGQGFEVKLPD
jgi:hypothetical protein